MPLCEHPEGEAACPNHGPRPVVKNGEDGLREALEFYASQGNYVPAGIAATIWTDQGQRARDALAKSRQEPPRVQGQKDPLGESTP